MSTLSLRQRSKELVLFALDEVLMSSLTTELNPELLSLSCIYVVIKLEGDFTPQIASFHEHVKSKFKNAKQSLIFYEGLLLGILSHSFHALLTLSDVNYAVLRLLKSQLIIADSIQSRMDELCTKSLVDLSAEPDLLSFSFWCFIKHSKAKLYYPQLIEFVNFLLKSRFRTDKSIQISIIKRLEYSMQKESLEVAELRSGL